MKNIISVAVITYNSSKTVIETLDSIYHQTYGAENIELIISDDASIDNTVAVIDDWLTLHESSFNKVIFFKNEVNGGVSKNINLAWTASTSEWIKTIAEMIYSCQIVLMIILIMFLIETMKTLVLYFH